MIGLSSANGNFYPVLFIPCWMSLIWHIYGVDSLRPENTQSMYTNPTILCRRVAGKIVMNYVAIPRRIHTHLGNFNLNSSYNLITFHPPAVQFAHPSWSKLSRPVRSRVLPRSADESILSHTRTHLFFRNACILPPGRLNRKPKIQPGTSFLCIWQNICLRFTDRGQGT